jgi:DNA-binding MarR family transcriptional regulator
MEYFLLVLIGPMGLGSLYALRQEVGLEPGGIRSALKHLIDGELIRREDEGKRRRRDMTLTPDGFAVLANSWRSCLLMDVDSESVLRAASVAWVMDGPRTAAAYLYEVGKVRQEQAERMNCESEYLERSQKGPTSSYCWMRAALEAHRRKAEGEAFVSMSRSIEERFRNDASNATHSAATSE